MPAWTARLVLLAIVAVSAVLGTGSTAMAQPAANIPQKYSELTEEQKSWRDAQGVIWCGDHSEFPGCAGNPTQGYSYPSDNSLFTVLLNRDNGDGASGTSIDLNPGNAVDAAIGKAVDSSFGKAAESIGKFAGDLLVESMTWWINTDSINLSYANVMSGSAPVQKLVVFIMMAGIMVSSIIMMLSRRAEPGVQILWGGLKYMVISSLALVVLSGALKAGDDFAQQMVDKDAVAFGERVQMMLGTNVLGNPGGVLLLGIIAVILGFVQWVMGFIRQAGILVLYNMILFAAAGQLTTWGRQWFPRIAAACIALVLYKPMAAFIYSLGFKLIGTEQTLSTLVTGLMVIALAVIALPAMMKFFDFMGAHVSGGSGALAPIMGSIAGGALMANAFGGSSGGSETSGGDSHANFMSATGPSASSAERDPSPGNGMTALPGGSGGGAIEGGSGKALPPGGGSGSGSSGAAGELEAGPSSTNMPSEHPDATGTPSTGAAAAANGVDVSTAGGASTLGASEGAGAAAGAGGAAGAGAAAATGGVSMAVSAGISAASTAVDAADSVAGEMSSGAETGPDMK
ncbi:hypothetical protein GCM10011591_46110 [Nocardia camponoti]|uniref:Type IV secretion system protein n=1 Tax=Nocardia camponoti TaxID=1616106 RepID=A0A917VE16_9NOCA|nr:hypothetical protein GCM10011591_46110 [Nocardia camponoti]